MIDFTVKPDGAEDFEVKAGTRDVLMWEKTSKGRSFSHLMNDLKMQDMYKLAHIAASRQGKYAGTLSDFESQCELKFEETEEVNPTQREASQER